MAIDFSQVKTITIPEGSVTKITDSNGNILWQSTSWHTIWEGSKTCSITKSGNDTPVISGAEENFAQTVAGTGLQPKIRITFSYSNTNTDPNWTTGYFLNGLPNTNPSSSPLTITIYNMFDASKLCSIVCKYVDADKKAHTVDVGLVKKRDTNNNRIIFNLKGFSSNDINSYSGNFTLTFTITKIEQYY